MHHGERLINALSKGDTGIMGKYIPMTCSMSHTDNKDDYCMPIEMEDEAYIEQFLDKNLDGKISFSYSSSSNKIADGHDFKYKQAQFGSRIENKETFVIVDGSHYDNSDFCDEIDPSIADFANKAVMVHRGQCSFAVKAQNIASTGAKLMLLVNDDVNEFSMGVESDYISSMIQLAAVMISKTTGKQIFELLNKSRDDKSVLNMILHPSSK